MSGKIPSFSRKSFKCLGADSTCKRASVNKIKGRRVILISASVTLLKTFLLFAWLLCGFPLNRCTNREVFGASLISQETKTNIVYYNCYIISQSYQLPHSSHGNLNWDIFHLCSLLFYVASGAPNHLLRLFPFSLKKKNIFHLASVKLKYIYLVASWRCLIFNRSSDCVQLVSRHV